MTMDALNLTLPGFGGGGGSSPAPKPKPLVKARYWTPDPNDETVYGGKPGYQGQAGPGYVENDAYWMDKIWDKEDEKWLNKGDVDPYEYDESGEQMYWHPPEEPKRKGVFK
jgi:hypothetical protein